MGQPPGNNIVTLAPFPETALSEVTCAYKTSKHDSLLLQPSCLTSDYPR